MNMIDNKKMSPFTGNRKNDYILSLYEITLVITASPFSLHAREGIETKYYYFGAMTILAGLKNPTLLRPRDNCRFRCHSRKKDY